jgi:hypothetical protein
MTAVACRLPQEQNDTDLWQVLQAAVRRASDAADERVLIADSKVVYGSGRGLAGLERGVLALLAPNFAEGALTLAGLLERLAPGDRAWCADPWHHGRSPLPQSLPREDVDRSAERLARATSEAALSWCHTQSILFCPAAFNTLVDRWQTKGAVLGEGLARLIQGCRAAAEPGESLRFFVDKHGGRNNYAALLQHAIPDGFVIAQEESNRRSTYVVRGTPQPIRLTFQPRADADHLCVAYASMVSKYLRELLMAEFNQFWQAEVPGLKPTAGYPVDAVRFFAAIRPVVERRGFAESVLWRKK